jgi:predicted methyltransferase MtxX (methanogen marker protein 4)
MVRYIITEREIADETHYGISAYGGENDVDRLEDIAVSYAEILRLTALLQENGVAVAHFRDVIEDYLAQ